MMRGWKTWLAAIGSIALGLYEVIDGQTEAGIGHITFGAGLIGIGSKVEKNTFPDAAVEMLKAVSEKQGQPPQEKRPKPVKPAPDTGYRTGF